MKNILQEQLKQLNKASWDIPAPNEHYTVSTLINRWGKDDQWQFIGYKRQGNKKKGHLLFILQNKSNSKIFFTYECEYNEDDIIKFRFT